MPTIVIIGSLNTDLISRVRAMPRPGQTILGDDFLTLPGGKGANQAVAAAKLAGAGTRVHLVGRVGADDFGKRLLDGLGRHGVGTRHVTVTERVASGVATILVDRKGENSIVVTPGANAKLSPADLDAAETLIRSASVVVMQLEIPRQTVRHAIATCQRLGIYTILDPAPAPAKGLPRAMFAVDLFTPNESEAEALLGITPRSRAHRKRTIEPKQMAGEFLARGAKAVALKLGSRGSVLIERAGGFQTIRPFKVRVTDTTAAGDAFTGALAVGRAEGMPLVEAMRFANAAGAICCQSFGAQPALPSREAVERLLRT